MHSTAGFELNPLMYWEPVQLGEERTGSSPGGGVQDQPRYSVLDQLQSMERGRIGRDQKAIAIVQAAQYKRLHQGFPKCVRKQGKNSTQ